MSGLYPRRAGYHRPVTVILLLAAVVLIVLGAIGFTNAVEWLGARLDLGHTAVGAILAAVGTALPESVIPIVALTGGSPEQVQIAVGSIVGAPFMLATLAMLLVALSAVGFRHRRETGERVTADRPGARRDLTVFLLLFPPAVLLGLGTPAWVQVAGAVVLVAGYALYVRRTVAAAAGQGSDEGLDALFFDRTRDDPPSGLEIGAQLLVALAAIIGGAEIFVTQVEQLASSVGVEPLVLALVLAPLTTELPEKLNSVLWMRRSKDTLALGNVTGAMAFQATLPVAIGLLLTEWELEPAAFAAAGCATAGAVVALAAIDRQRFTPLPAMVWGTLLTGFVVWLVVI
jgi:cation:H+ antiporter